MLKIVKNQLIFHRVIQKIKRWTFWDTVYICVVCVQMIVRCQRPTTTVHLAGSFIIGHLAMAQAVPLLRTYEQRHHHNYVLKPVPLAPHVFLRTGLDTIRPAICIPGEVDVVRIPLTSHSSRSSDSVTIHQVRDIFAYHQAYVKLCSKFHKSNMRKSLFQLNHAFLPRELCHSTLLC